MGSFNLEQITQLRQVFNLIRNSGATTFDYPQLLDGATKISDKIIDNKVLEYIPELCKDRDGDYSLAKLEQLIERLENDLVKDVAAVYNNGLEFIKEIQDHLTSVIPSIHESIERLAILAFTHKDMSFEDDIESIGQFLHNLDGVSEKFVAHEKIFQELFNSVEESRTLVYKLEKNQKDREVEHSED